MTSTLVTRITVMMELLTAVAGAVASHGLKELLAQNSLTKMALDSFQSKIILTT